jgi:hypothetical protein
MQFDAMTRRKLCRSIVLSWLRESRGVQAVQSDDDYVSKGDMVEGGWVSFRDEVVEK